MGLAEAALGKLGLDDLLDLALELRRILLLRRALQALAWVRSIFFLAIGEGNERVCERPHARERVCMTTVAAIVAK